MNDREQVQNYIVSFFQLINRIKFLVSLLFYNRKSLTRISQVEEKKQFTVEFHILLRTYENSLATISDDC